jgi:hypothetical protein
VAGPGFTFVRKQMGFGDVTALCEALQHVVSFEWHYAQSLKALGNIVKLPSTNTLSHLTQTRWAPENGSDHMSPGDRLARDFGLWSLLGTLNFDYIFKVTGSSARPRGGYMRMNAGQGGGRHQGSPRSPGSYNPGNAKLSMRDCVRGVR